MQELNCAVVRDLLPLYVEDLVSPETKEQVECHLEGCPECRERRERMGVNLPALAEENLREAVPLKRVYWRLALIILGFPVWFPLLLSAAVVAISLYIALWAVLLALWCVPLSFACAAVVLPLAGWFGFGIAGGSAALYAFGGAAGYAVRFGAFLACGGLAVLSGYGCWWLTRQVLRFTCWLGRAVKSLVTEKKEDRYDGQ